MKIYSILKNFFEDSTNFLVSYYPHPATYPLKAMFCFLRVSLRYAVLYTPTLSCPVSRQHKKFLNSPTCPLSSQLPAQQILHSIHTEKLLYLLRKRRLPQSCLPSTFCGGRENSKLLRLLFPIFAYSAHAAHLLHLMQMNSCLSEQLNRSNWISMN